jgi:hypothetical protein
MVVDKSFIMHKTIMRSNLEETRWRAYKSLWKPYGNQFSSSSATWEREREREKRFSLGFCALRAQSSHV